MKTKPLTQPTAYRAYILAPQKDGSVDLIDPTTGRWIRSSITKTRDGYTAGEGK